MQSKSLKLFENINKRFSLNLWNKSIKVFFGVLLLVEIIFLCVLFVSDVIRPKEDIEISQLQVVSGEDFSLKSGAYQFVISYQSNVDGKHSISNSAGSVSLKSNYHEIESDIIQLDDAHNFVTGQIWVPAFTEYDDLSFQINYYGTGELLITDCKIIEYPIYRLVRFIGLLLVFILIDLFILYFFSNTVFSIKKVVLFIMLFVFAASVPFMESVLYGGNDLWFHLARIVSVAQGLSDGQVPVRLSTELNNGYGYVNSLYYCDIFLYPFAVLYMLKVPLRLCYQLYVISVNVFTGVLTYYAMSKFTKNDITKLLGTALYMLCTYRFVNLCVRSAVGEYTAMCFLPLVVVGFNNLFYENKYNMNGWLPLSIGISGIVMSHIVSLEIVVINIVFLSIFLIKKFFNIKRLIAILKAFVACIAMSIWFLLPFLDSIINQTTTIQSEELQMLSDTTRPIIELLSFFASGKDMISLGISFVVGGILLLCCLCFWKKKNTSVHNRELDRFRLICFLAFINVLFVSNLFPWDTVQKLLGIESLGYQLGTIQFVQRFMSVASILLSVAIVIAVNYVDRIRNQIYKGCIIVLSMSILLGCGFFYYRFYDSNPPQFAGINYKNYVITDDLYLPEGTKISTFDISECKSDNERVQVEEYNRENGAVFLSVRNETGNDAKISIPVIAYNNYKVYYESEEELVELKYENDENNCIRVVVPAGFDGIIQVKFVAPISWRISEVVSALTWISLVCIGLIRIYRKRIISLNKKKHQKKQ